jgi:bifunctional UDP-N-acetylglucosamine pyrophosphorylase/glucosamine-1-phosphate N-acetyltransferase
VREVFPSLYCVKAEKLVDLLGQLKNNNAKREYYLTDIFSLARQGGGKVLAVKCVSGEEIRAPNTRGELAEADAIMQRRIVAKLHESGVTVVSPGLTYIEAGAEVGAETKILPFTFIGAGASIGDACTIGPFAHVARDSVVKAHTTLAGNLETAALSGLAESVA